MHRRTKEERPWTLGNWAAGGCVEKQRGHVVNPLEIGGSSAIQVCGHAFPCIDKNTVHCKTNFSCLSSMAPKRESCQGRRAALEFLYFRWEFLYRTLLKEGLPGFVPTLTEFVNGLRMIAFQASYLPKQGRFLIPIGIPAWSHVQTTASNHPAQTGVRKPQQQENLEELRINSIEYELASNSFHYMARWLLHGAGVSMKLSDQDIRAAY